MLRLLTAGESHGKALVSILDGFPAGLKVDLDKINAELRQRQGGYGRSGRQLMETDEVDMLGGLRQGITSGAPIAYTIVNRDNKNWLYVMKVRPLEADEEMSEESKAQHLAKKISQFRPGHADYAGLIKYAQRDVRDVLERSSARETASRVAAGAFCRELLRALDVQVASHVVQIGSAASNLDLSNLSIAEIEARAAASEVFCVDEAASQAMKDVILETQKEGDSLGGIVEVVIDNLPIGLGSYTQWDRRLDGLLAHALMSIQAMKAVEIGDGLKAAGLKGSVVHDAMYPSKNSNDAKYPVQRKTNHAGGIEGGMTNGERLVVRAYMKPIPTIKQGLPSVSFPDFAEGRAHYERSDVCAVPAASVVARAMVCLTVANLFLDKFASDSAIELTNSVKAYRESCRSLSLPVK